MKTLTLFALNDKQLSEAVIPAEQSQWEPDDHPPNEGKVRGFSFSANWRSKKLYQISAFY